MSSKQAICRGTVASVVGAFRIGDTLLSQPQISMLVNLVPGIAKAVGTVKQKDGGKGRPATVYDWFASGLVKLELAPGAKIAEVDEARFAKLQSPTGKAKVVEEAATA